jgi:hypothetical protein
MPKRALGTGGDMGVSTEGGIVDSVAEALAIVISSRTTGLGMPTALIPIFMGGSSLTYPRYGSPLHPTLVWRRPLPHRLHLCGTTAQTQQAIIR